MAGRHVTGIWLPGVERLPDGDHVGNMVAGARPKLLLHKTQSPVGTAHPRSANAAWDAVIATLSGNRSQPHLVYDPSVRRAGQYISLDRAGAALANDPGGVETNRGGPIQVEILGYSEDSAADPDEWVTNFATDIAVPVMRLLGIPPVLYKPFVGAEAGFIAREDAPQRMPLGEWLGFTGVLAHQNAPENEHWDVGAYKGDLLITTCARLLAGHDPEETFMAALTEAEQRELLTKVRRIDTNATSTLARTKVILEVAGGLAGMTARQLAARIKTLSPKA